MKTKAIFFDKDGTLIDFDAIWVTVSYTAIGALLKKISMEHILVAEILEIFGIHNDVTDIEGIICKGTYKLMGEALYNYLKEKGCENTVEEITDWMVEEYHKYAAEADIKPACKNIREVLKELKSMGIIINLITTDDAYITNKCLAAIGIEDCFDVIFTDDGEYPTKPDPYCINKFCDETNIAKSEIIMVGDTMTDALFAKNSGVKFVGVAKNQNNRKTLETETDTVIYDISYLKDVIY